MKVPSFRRSIHHLQIEMEHPSLQKRLIKWVKYFYLNNITH